MTEDRFERSLRAFRQRQPFKPFLVELASGIKLVVEHPEALAHRGRVAAYINPDGAAMSARFAASARGVLSLAMTTSCSYDDDVV
jgi:hypothetical protein